jgi:hypothetical protein
VIDGAQEREFLGDDVEIVGDVNGDGIDDVLVAGSGSADYVIFGKRDTDSVSVSAIAEGSGGGFAIAAATDDGVEGGGYARAGDVNGDGLADMVTSVAGDQPGARVIFGRSSVLPVDLALSATTGFRILAGGSLEVAGAADVNGDGFDDVIVGRSVNAGAAYVVFGKGNNLAVDTADLEAGQGGGFAIRGARAGDRAGGHVGGGGDVNGDGLADVLVGAATAPSNGATFAGRAYVIFGKTNSTPVQLIAVESGSENGFSIDGSGSNDNAGSSLLSLGDVNGDGMGDVLVASPQASRAGFTATGVTSVVFGKSDRAPVPLAALEDGGPGGFAILSNGVSLDSGRIVASADFNDDGRMDIVLGDRAIERALVIFGQ